MNTYYLKASVGTLMAVAALLWLTASTNAVEEEFLHEVVPLADVNPELLRGSNTRFFYPLEPPTDEPNMDRPEPLLREEI